MIFFILGTLISLFSGAFEVLDGMENVRIIVLVILGVIVGILNISENDQINFLISSIAFLLSANFLIGISPARMFVLDGLFLMLNNLMIFIAPATLIVALKYVFEYASESHKTIVLETPKSDRTSRENAWDIVVFVAVAFVLVALILESFFNLAPYPELVTFLLVSDYIVLGIFVIDLFVLYNRQKNLKLFFMRNWLDIIAVIPFGSVFRLTKVVRLARIMRIFTRAHRASRVNRVSKFFSGESGFNKILSPEEQKSEKNVKSKKGSTKASKSLKAKKKKK